MMCPRILWYRVKLNKDTIFSCTKFCVTFFLAYQANSIAQTSQANLELANDIAKTSQAKLELETIAEILRLEQDLFVGKSSRDEKEQELHAAKLSFYKDYLQQHMKQAYVEYEKFTKASPDPNSQFAMNIKKSVQSDREAKARLDRDAKARLDREAKSWWRWW